MRSLRVPKDSISQNGHQDPPQSRRRSQVVGACTASQTLKEVANGDGFSGAVAASSVPVVTIRIHRVGSQIGHAACGAAG